MNDFICTLPITKCNIIVIYKHHILLGQSPHYADHPKNRIVYSDRFCDFGGSRESSTETYWETAVRELQEETCFLLSTTHLQPRFAILTYKHPFQRLPLQPFRIWSWTPFKTGLGSNLTNPIPVLMYAPMDRPFVDMRITFVVEWNPPNLLGTYWQQIPWWFKHRQKQEPYNQGRQYQEKCALQWWPCNLFHMVTFHPPLAHPTHYHIRNTFLPILHVVCREWFYHHNSIWSSVTSASTWQPLNASPLNASPLKSSTITSPTTSPTPTPTNPMPLTPPTGMSLWMDPGLATNTVDGLALSCHV